MILDHIALKFKKLTLLLVSFLGALSIYSQSGAVKGFVYDKANGEPVPFCNVYFKGTTIGANTDLNGFFSITRIKPGNYTLLVTSLDFDTINDQAVTVRHRDKMTQERINLTQLNSYITEQLKRF